MNRNIIAGIAAAVLGLASGYASAMDAVTVEECWQNWLTNNKLSEGENALPNGNIQFVAVGQQTVMSASTSGRWVTERGVAFDQAQLQARSKLAEYLGQAIRSEQVSSVFRAGGDDAPAPPGSLGRMEEGLSLVEKTQVLRGMALDAKIREFDPEWDGTNKTDEERRAKVVTLQQSYERRISSRAATLILGATVATQCEGPAAADGSQTSGRYEVLVGMIWSYKLAYEALAMTTPGIGAVPAKGGKSLNERFAEMSAADPDWMTSVLGLRIFPDENGERVLVGFASVPASALKNADISMAKLIATDWISRFAGEAIEIENQLEQSLVYRQFDGTEEEVLDPSTYYEIIKSRAQVVRLTGVHQVLQWRGKHPYSDEPMQIVAVAWSPSAAKAARSMETVLSPDIVPTGDDDQIDTGITEGAPADASDF